MNKFFSDYMGYIFYAFTLVIGWAFRQVDDTRVAQWIARYRFVIAGAAFGPVLGTKLHEAISSIYSDPKRTPAMIYSTVFVSLLFLGIMAFFAWCTGRGTRSPLVTFSNKKEIVRLILKSVKHFFFAFIPGCLFGAYLQSSKDSIDRTFTVATVGAILMCALPNFIKRRARGNRGGSGRRRRKDEQTDEIKGLIRAAEPVPQRI